MIPAKLVYPQGRVQGIVIPAAGSIAVQTGDKAQVFQLVGFPNEPSVESLLGTVLNGETVFGPFASGATIIIIASAAQVAYAVGVSPRVMVQAQSQTQGAPGVLNATGPLTAAMIAAGIVTSTAGAAVAATLDTGTVMDAALDMQIGDSFDWAVILTGANAFTVTASAGHTVVGNVVVPASKSGMFRTRKTAAATFITYGLAAA